MTHEQVIMMLESARKNMMDDSMRDYAGEQIDVVLAWLQNKRDATSELRQFIKGTFDNLARHKEGD